MLHSYSTVLINAPVEIAARINKFCKEKIKDKDLYIDPDDPTLGREDEPHITVKYGLHTSDSGKVKELVSSFGSFEVKLGKISKFTSEKYDVIKAEVESEKLHKLNALVSDNLECTDSHPKYIPHLTLAYVKNNACEALLGDESLSGVNWSVADVLFADKNEKKTKISIVKQNSSNTNNWWTRKVAKKKKRTIALDFDGVLHRYRKGYTGREPEEGPVRGAVDFVRKLIKDGWEVVVHSARIRNVKDREAIEKWLKKHDFPKLSVVSKKPPAEIYVDDNGYRFDGNFDKLQRFLAKHPCSWATK